MTLGIGILGCGTVGGALVDLIEDQPGLEVRQVAVRSTTKARSGRVDASILTTNAESVVGRADVDIVVEVIGGIEPARSLILAALNAGKPVVTANKELIANCGAELLAAADRLGVDVICMVPDVGELAVDLVLDGWIPVGDVGSCRAYRRT